MNMSQIRLALADKDTRFLSKLSDYLQKNRTTRFIMELFTSPANLEEWLAHGGTADLIAISSSFFSEMSAKPGSKNVVILGDGADSLIPEGYSSIRKYVPAENLMKEIISLCAENIRGGIREKADSGNIHFVVYADGSGLTNPLGPAMAGVLAKSGKQVFYINLDELSDTDSYFTGTNSKGLSEMLYYVKSNKSNLAMKAEACTSKDMESGVYFMKGQNNPDDTASLSPSECEALIQSIRACCDDIVISRAFRADPVLPVLLKNAQNIYIASSCCGTSRMRLLKIISLLPGFEEKYEQNIKNRILICTAAFDSRQPVRRADIPSCPEAVLPFPYEEVGSDSFSEDYMTAVGALLNKRG